MGKASSQSSANQNARYYTFKFSAISRFANGRGRASGSWDFFYNFTPLHQHPSFLLF